MAFRELEWTREEEEILRFVGRQADAAGYPCYAIGGFVRDKILGRSVQDVDFVCEGSGVDLARRVAKALDAESTLAVFRNFGTAQVRHGDWHLEFVGARRESYRRNSRKPAVEDGTLEDDQRRRDFTINALAVRVNEDDFGAFIDPFGGLGDLASKCIRTPLEPAATFSDDPLRMLRAIRFATRLGFRIDEDAMEALRREADRIDIVSKERISDELNKIILANKPSVGFHLLADLGLLERFLPELTDLRGVEDREGKAHKDNFLHTLQVLDNLARTSDDLWLRWAALLHDVAKPATKRFQRDQGWTFHGHEAVGARMVPGIFRRLKLPLGAPMKFVRKMVLLHLRPISLTRENVTDSAIRRLLFDAGDDIDSLMQLCEADITSKNKRKVRRYLDNFEMVRTKLEEVEENDRIRNWQPPISGEDVMTTFGIPPGREVGIIKNAIREAILDGEIRNDREEARAFMLAKGREIGLRVADADD